MKSLNLLTILIFLCQCLHAQFDSEGWTILNASKAAKIIYVSSSEGNDNLGQVYAYQEASVGPDVQLPVDIIPFKSIAAVDAILQDGEATWVLFKTGDVFEGGLRGYSGKSKDEPFVYTYYGDDIEIPLFLTGKDYGINYCCKDFANFWVIGLSFYAHTRDPNHTMFSGFDGGQSGFHVYTQTLESNVLVEGCRFRFYANNVIQGPNHKVGNFTFRRNLFLDNYSVDAHSQGMYTSGADSFLLEENIFDHNGWYKQTIDLNNKGEGMATFFNHNTYFVNSVDVTFRENGFYRPSSIGTKWTSGYKGAAHGVRIENNLFHDFEVGMSIGGNDSQPSYRFKDFQVRGNVLCSAGKSQPTARNLGWYIGIEDWDGGDVSNNYLIHQDQDYIGNVFGISIKGENKNMAIHDNIFHSLKNGDGLRIFKPLMDSCIIINNDINLPLGNGQYLIEADSLYPNIFQENNYYTPDQNTQGLFRLEQNDIGLSDWTSAVNEMGYTMEHKAYKDTSRTLETYVSRVLELSSMESFFVELRKQSIFNWNSAYTTATINEWIKKGYSITEPSNTINHTDQDIPLLCYPNPTSGYINLPDEVIGGAAFIYDTNGKLVSHIDNVKSTINLNLLSKGIYSIVVNKEGRRYQQMLVIE